MTPPRIIIDASATLDWLFDDNDGHARIGPVVTVSSLVAPSLWLLEVTNTVLTLERRRRITATQGVTLLRELDAIGIELVPEPTTRTATALADTARPFQLTAYDAAYFDLAVRTGLPLLTRDGNLRAAAGRVGVSLVAEATP